MAKNKAGRTIINGPPKQGKLGRAAIKARRKSGPKGNSVFNRTARNAIGGGLSRIGPNGGGFKVRRDSRVGAGTNG